MRFLVSTAALAALCLGACAAQPRGPAPLRVVFWAGVEELAAEQANVDAFMQAHPGVRVSLESIPDSYLEKLVTAFAAKKPPDVLLLDSVVIPHFVDGGVLLDLAALPGAGRRRSTAGSSSRRCGSIAARPRAAGGEAVYALPKDFTPLVVYYNKRVFDAARGALPARRLELGRLPRHGQGADARRERRRAQPDVTARWSTPGWAPTCPGSGRRAATCSPRRQPRARATSTARRASAP